MYHLLLFYVKVSSISLLFFVPPPLEELDELEKEDGLPEACKANVG